MEDQLVHLEVLCHQLYESTDESVRQQAEKALVNFSTSANSISQCQMLLENSQSPYALLLASSTLSKLITSPTNSLSLTDRFQLRNYILQYLSSHINLSAYVIRSLIQLIARVTKHGWFDFDKSKGYIFRDILDEIGKFLQGSVAHCIIGIQVLHELVVEMNTVESARSLANHRKVAGSFRDETLYDVFTLSTTLLQQTIITDGQQVATMLLHQGNLYAIVIRKSAEGGEECMESAMECTALYHCVVDCNDNYNQILIEWLLKLCSICLCFDFIGNSSDESSDDFTTVQIPTNWRPLFRDFSTLNLFLGFVHSLPYRLSAIALSCLVQLASVRRSLFSNLERSQYLEQLTKGIKDILEMPQCLSDPVCYHEFCRLLVRLKSNYQLAELMKLEHYPQFLQLIAKFTISSLQSWQFSENSIHYLLCLWQKMVGSVAYIRVQDNHLLNSYVPDIVKMYITSRLESVEGVLRNGLENPLDDETGLGQQLDQISVIARCDYHNTCELLMSLFDSAASVYEQLIQSNSSNEKDLQLKEGQLSWLLHLIGHVIGGRTAHSSSATYDSIDGQLVCRVLQLMNLTDSNLSQRCCEHIDIAILGFFEQFRKIYIGEMIHKSAQVYQVLGEQLGLNDETSVLNVIVRKMFICMLAHYSITNLKLWAHNRLIMIKTLTLLQDLSLGFSSVRKLFKLDSIQFILSNHNADQFPFLSVAATSLLDTRCRTVFYVALGRLLMVELGENDDRFIQFMSPITSTLDQVSVAMNSSHGQITEEQVKHMIVGTARDLIGILIAFSNKRSYGLFFDWIYPKYLEIFLKALRLWYSDSFVTTPILKLMSEFAHNRSQRLAFDVTSPNGVLLFREASKTIVTYGSQILTLVNIPEQEIYQRKLKGISICFSLLRSALCGSYVNFGVLKLYGDTAMDDVMDVFVKLLISIPLKNLLDFPKLSASYYPLLETLTQFHMNFLSSLEPNVIIYILSSLSEGLNSLDTSICTGSCSSLDHILSYLFKHLKQHNLSLQSSLIHSSTLLQLPQLQPGILQEMLQSILNTVMFEKCRIQWSMSRPLLGLILLNEETIQIRMVATQPVDRQSSMMLCFENLMDGIEYNLNIKNRDKFTQNLSVFRRDLTISLKDTTQPSETLIEPHPMMS